MNGEALWNNIISELSSGEQEVQTKGGLWFKAIVKEGRLYIDKATENKPSCKISVIRPISKKDFLFVHSFYDRWASGDKKVRLEASNKSQNTTYIFSLISHFLN